MKPSQDVSAGTRRLELSRTTDIIQGMNCEKNAVVCEGYHEKQIWKSGKERAEEGELQPVSLDIFLLSR